MLFRSRKISFIQFRKRSHSPSFGSSLKKIDSDDYVVARDSDSNLVQRCVPQQKIITKTDVGIMEGYVTLSCFMLGDTPSALYARFSDERIAGNEAYWIPVLF